MLLRFAFALNHDFTFGKNHFGDADQYLIYQWNEEGFNRIEEMNNHFKTMDEYHDHGSRKKGQAIIETFKEKGVKVLVSKQFGRNIKMVNNHFVPVIVSADTVDEVKSVIYHHVNWLMEEVNNQPERHKLFDLRKGVLKTIIPKD